MTKVCIIMKYLCHDVKKSYVISYHGTLCHDMSYVTTIVASLLYMVTQSFYPHNFIFQTKHDRFSRNIARHKILMASLQSGIIYVSWLTACLPLRPELLPRGLAYRCIRIMSSTSIGGSTPCICCV